MTPGLSTDLQTVADLRKASILSKEFLRVHLDIAALQETWLADSGTFFWQGKGNMGSGLL